METKPATDFGWEIFHWMLIGVDIFGGALLRNDRMDRWASLYNCPHKILGVPYDPRGWWECDHGPIGPAERQSFHRAARALEAAGLVELVRQHGSRLSHLRPTPRGLQVALRLNPEADLRAIRKALQTADWATKKHIEAVGTRKAGTR